LVVLGALLATMAFADPIKYTIFAKSEKEGKMEKVGSLVTETTGDDDSGYVDDTTTSLTKEDKTLTIHELVHYGKDGVATSRTMELSGAGVDVKIKAALSDDGAKVSLWEGDQKDEKEIALATKTSRADATNFWFKKKSPKEGDSVTYQTFDVQELKWSDVTLKYVGKAKVKVGDKELEENEIDRTEGDETSQVYVDDKGDAVLFVDGEMRIERQM
jgi:hypothetical protein